MFPRLKALELRLPGALTAFKKLCVVCMYSCCVHIILLFFKRFVVCSVCVV